MRAFFHIAYVLIGFVQLFAVWDGVERGLGVESFFGKMIAFFITLFVTYIPLVGSAIGVYGAVNVWDWDLAKSLLLFFWYVPVFIIVMTYSYVTDRS